MPKMGERGRKVVAPSMMPMPEEQRCGATTRRGEKCRSGKGARTDHPGYGNCAKHGGNTPAGVKAAMREMGSDLVETFKAQHMRWGGNRNDPSIATLTPESALLEEVRRSAAMVRFLEERIAQWNLTSITPELVERFVQSPDAKRGDTPSMRHHIEELLEDLVEPNPDDDGLHLPPLSMIHPKTGFTSYTDAREWLLLYREERGHLARVSKMCIDAGVAQRLVSIAEDQGRILSSAIRAVLVALNLSEEQQRMIPHIVPPILRAVATDQPIPDVKMLLTSTAG